MRIFPRGLPIVLGLVLVTTGPGSAQEQEWECLPCETEYWWEGEEVCDKHRFESTGEEAAECLRHGGGGGGELDGLPSSGPAEPWDGCESCHNDWIEGGSCVSSHPPCWPHDLVVGEVRAEVDRLLNELAATPRSAAPGQVSTLVAHIHRVAGLSIDPDRKSVILADCRGETVAEWDAPPALLKRVRRPR